MPNLHKTLVFASLLIFSACVYASTQDDCAGNLERVRQDMLTSLFRFHQNILSSSNNMEQFWETLYSWQWTAAQSRSEKFTPEKRTEGEILYQRYSEWAKDDESQMDEDWNQALRELKKIRLSFSQVRACCRASDFRNCMGPRMNDLKVRLMRLRKWVLTESKRRRIFNDHVRDSLKDTPSGHDAFADRYVEDLQLYLKKKLELNHLVLDVRHELEDSWPGDSCCAACSEKAVTSSNDPVLDQLQVGAASATGVAGRVVNHSNIVRAFEDEAAGKPIEVPSDPVLDHLQNLWKESKGIVGKNGEQSSLVRAFDEKDEKDAASKSAEKK